MLGWWIVVSVRDLQDQDAGVAADPSATLASWEVGIGGLDWLDELVAADKAEQQWYHGYPNRYTALAADVLPLLADGTPPGTGPADEHRRRALHPDRIAGCAADRPLTVDAWDQS
ncbi:hypothetical protein ACWGB8_05915 [Kitasatospora sp. NPDC054939]